MMKRFVVLSFLLVLISCASDKNRASQELAGIIQRVEDHQGYDKDEFPLGRFSGDYYATEAAFAKEQLGRLAQLDQEKLNESELISYELLRFVLQNRIDFDAFQMYLNPILSDAGFHSNLVYLVKPLDNYDQTKIYLDKLNDIPRFVDEHFALLKEGLEKGVSQPRIIFEGYESSYDTHITDHFEDSFFYSPFKHLPSDLNESQKDSVLAEAKKSIENKVVPQFKRIKEFFEGTYYPETRTEIGISATPGGQEYYQNRINFYTTSDQYTAADIHEIGLKEVKRIRRDMQAVINDLNFEGSFADFFQFLRTDDHFYAKPPEELMMIARDMAKRADAQLPRFFITLPRKPYGVAPVPDAIAPKYTGGRYVGTEKNSSDPGYYWVNTYDLKSRTLYTLPALTVHEAVPGHHLQISLNSELGDSIPNFRKELYLSAYGEGWGLYSEFLAAEMGMYTSPYERFGQLTYEMWRACRLVVDTGIHAMGWTREEVLAFMSENTALSLHEIATETDRYISWPGQALSYKIGELKIRELRSRAEASLGGKFDIREFHEVILEQGTVTLPILERRVNHYIEQKSNGKKYL